MSALYREFRDAAGAEERKIKHLASAECGMLLHRWQVKWLELPDLDTPLGPRSFSVFRL